MICLLEWRSRAKIRISRAQSQIYLSFAEREYLRPSVKDTNKSGAKQIFEYLPCTSSYSCSWLRFLMVWSSPGCFRKYCFSISPILKKIAFAVAVVALFHHYVVVVWRLEMLAGGCYARKIQKVVFLLGVDHSPCIFGIGTCARSGNHQQQVVELVLPYLARSNLAFCSYT